MAQSEGQVVLERAWGGNSRSHVRPASTYTANILAEATQYSPTINAIAAQIGESNVIAHVECAHFVSLTLKGRTMFVTARQNVRYVRVQVDCLLMREELIAIIGHELQHVAEIASASEVVDESSFGRMLNRIGHPTCCGAQEQYETTAAFSVEERVTKEMSSRDIALAARNSSSR